MKSISYLSSFLAAFPALVFAADDSQPALYEELIVTSSRIQQPLREVATSVSVITREDLDLTGYNSLAAVLRNQPGIGVSNTGGVGQQTTLRIRGEEGYRTLLLIDGVDVSDTSATQKGPLFQNIASSYDIERIEVLRGPQGFMYGADAGGVINIITQNYQQGLGGKLTAESGSYGTTNLGGTFHAGNETAGLALSLSQFDTDGYSAQVADTHLNDDDGSKNTTLHLKGGWQITENLEITAVYRDIDLEYEYDGCFDSSTFTTVHGCTGENTQENLKLSLQYDTGPISHQLSLSEASIERDSFTNSVLSFAAESDSTQIEYLGSWALDAENTFVYGIDYEDDDMGNNFGTSWQRDQLGLFAEYQLELSEQLYVTAGLRYDDNSDFGKHTSGRISAAYVMELNNDSILKLRSTLGTGFRAPSLAEIAYNTGPSQFGTVEGVVLNEETSQGFDLGADWLFANGATVSLTYFDQRIEDEIFYEFDSITFHDGYRQGNGESGSKGVELAFDLPITHALILEANITYNDTEDTAGLQRARRPEKLANLALRYVALEGKLNILSNLRLSRDAQDRFSVPLDDYHLLDLSASYAINTQLQVFGRIENLTDEDYIEVVGFNTAERAGYLGVRYQF